MIFFIASLVYAYNAYNKEYNEEEEETYSPDNLRC